MKVNFDYITKNVSLFDKWIFIKITLRKCHNNVLDGVVIHCLTRDMINETSVEYLPDKCI